MESFCSAGLGMQRSRGHSGRHRSRTSGAAKAVSHRSGIYFCGRCPPANDRDPDPVKLRLLEQAQHLLEIAVIDVGQHVLFGVEFVAPPGALGLPALDLSAVDPVETKIFLLPKAVRPPGLERYNFGAGSKD
jgi:hypothetical protein